MEPLRVIGYWGDAQQSNLPHPSAFVDLSWDADEREAIAYYLGRGVLARAYMGYSPCRLCDKRDNGNLEFSDGTYVWPQGLVRNRAWRASACRVRRACLRHRGTARVR